MDKEKIINGVDVSGCEFNVENPLHEIKHSCNIRGYEKDDGLHIHLKCKDNPDCYYKQLKRLEQEVKHWQMECREAKAKGEWTYDLVYKKVERLEQENEQIKKDYAKLHIDFAKCNEENERLKTNKGRCAFKCLDNTFCPEADKKITELELSRDSYKVSYETAKKYREKAEKALQEISKIARNEVETRILFADEKSFCDFYDILTKINEVIGAE